MAVLSKTIIAPPTWWIGWYLSAHESPVAPGRAAIYCTAHVPIISIMMLGLLWKFNRHAIPVMAHTWVLATQQDVSLRHNQEGFLTPLMRTVAGIGWTQK